jgi:AcrR family transcriptional regulator
MSPRMPKEHAEFRRRQVIAAAWDCFTENGYHETTVRDIAQRMKTSTGVIYRYFKGKDEILEAVNLCGQKGTAQFLDLAARKETSREAFAELLRVYGEEMSEADRVQNARGAIALWAEALKRKNYLKICESQQGLVFDLLTRLIKRGITAGEFKVAVDPEAFAGFILALLTGLQVQSVLFPGLDTSAYYEKVQRILVQNIWDDDSQTSTRRKKVP